jgi:hypothetical protein
MRYNIHTVTHQLHNDDKNSKIVKFFIEKQNDLGEAGALSEVLDVRCAKKFGAPGVYDLSILAWSSSPATLEEVQLIGDIWKRAELEARLIIATLEFVGLKAIFTK